MKNIITLAIALLSLSSCNAKDEIKVDKTTLIWSQVEPLSDYSYKGYQIEPYTNYIYSYKMPIEIGSEWLVLYTTEKNEERILDLKPYTIQDSISMSLITKYTVRLYSYPEDPVDSSRDSMIVPVFNVPDIILSEPKGMIFFKGFDKYNTNFANDKISDYYTPEEGGKNEPLWILYNDFKYDGRSFSLLETYIESDADVKKERVEGVKQYAHYIIYKHESQSQCLIYRQAGGEILNIVEIRN